VCEIASQLIDASAVRCDVGGREWVSSSSNSAGIRDPLLRGGKRMTGGIAMKLVRSGRAMV